MASLFLSCVQSKHLINARTVSQTKPIDTWSHLDPVAGLLAHWVNVYTDQSLNGAIAGTPATQYTVIHLRHYANGHI